MPPRSNAGIKRLCERSEAISKFQRNNLSKENILLTPLNLLNVNNSISDFTMPSRTWKQHLGIKQCDSHICSTHVLIFYIYSS